MQEQNKYHFQWLDWQKLKELKASSVGRDKRNQTLSSLQLEVWIAVSNIIDLSVPRV